MKSLVLSLFAQVLTGAIVFTGLVVVVFTLTGQWPPQEMVMGASIGGALSPLFWRLIRWASGSAGESTDENKTVLPR